MRYVVKRRRKQPPKSAWWIFDTKHKEYVIGYASRSEQQAQADEWNAEELEHEASVRLQWLSGEMHRAANIDQRNLDQEEVRELFSLHGLRSVGA